MKCASCGRGIKEGMEVKVGAELLYHKKCREEEQARLKRWNEDVRGSDKKKEGG